MTPRNHRTRVLAAIASAAAVLALALALAGCAAPPEKKATFSEYSWDEIAAIANEISGATTETRAVDIARQYNIVGEDGKLDGSQVKEIQVSEDEVLQAVLIGLAHDDKASGGKAGMTFMLKEVVAQQPMGEGDTNEGGWEASTIRDWLNNHYKDELPDEIKSKIVKVKKLTNNVGMVESADAVSQTEDDLWLLSEVEICGDALAEQEGLEHVSEVLEAEGTQYKCFKDMGVVLNTSNSVLVRTYEDLPESWWTRSPNPVSSSYFFGVTVQGDPYMGLMANSTAGVAPCFCI